LPIRRDLRRREVILPVTGDILLVGIALADPSEMEEEFYYALVWYMDVIGYLRSGKRKLIQKKRR
jgi:hypothetical protein